MEGNAELMKWGNNPVGKKSLKAGVKCEKALWKYQSFRDRLNLSLELCDTLLCVLDINKHLYTVTRVSEKS